MLDGVPPTELAVTPTAAELDELGDEVVSVSTSLIPIPGRALTPELAAPLHENPAVLYLASLTSAASVATMRIALRTIAERAFGWREPFEQFPWHLLRAAHTQRLRAWLVARYKPSSCQVYLAALRGVLRAALRLDLMSERDHRMAIDLAPIRGVRLPAGRKLAAGEIRTLFQCCRDDHRPAKGARDAAMIATLYGAGVRRFELCALDYPSGLERGAPDLSGWAVRMIGKGNKERRTPIPRGTAAAIVAWVAFRGEEPGPLFYPSTRCGHAFRAGDRFALGSINRFLSHLARRAGVDHFSPHDARRTYITDLFEVGQDANVIADLVGHAQLETTRRYDRRGERAKFAAAELVHVPYEAPAPPPPPDGETR